MTHDILQRGNNESFLDYQVRLFSNKDTYKTSFDEIADLLNKEYGSNYGESKWRKSFKEYCNWKDYILSKNLDKEILDKYEEMRVEAEKEKIRKLDQKREYNKAIRNQARFEKLRDDLQDGIQLLERKKPLTFKPSSSTVENVKHGLALFSDWHFGMEVDNSVNKFNKEIFDARVNLLVSKIVDYGLKNEIHTLHVANLGDQISGTIHISTRVQSNEDLVEQVQYVSEVLSEIVSHLSSIFPKVVYYNVIGNHGRSGKKDEVGLKENYEYLIPWYMEARLRNHPNVTIKTDKDGYILDKIFDEEVVYAHGNFDNPNQSVNRLPQLLGVIPKHIFTGHIHHKFSKEYGVTRVHVNPSLIGADDHSTSGRYGGKPAQSFFVFDKEDGLESEYYIRLDKVK
ncbi:hypothetical protein SAMN05421503_1439 [Terribacillus aidingensis]|uniref:Calcineurin-like phosphoesterase superfamily domain-containing protein n=1 Tax=Terribacillus aidingensis TaxID=586416 RepID=A0A285NKE3_9BACI|nr:hypothetical protein [Terribacillus aidingensis]SNZ09962.1 hypothetical protein SAMN05421503_1439 [Terribacillus aidingensis]